MADVARFAYDGPSLRRDSAVALVALGTGCYPHSRSINKNGKEEQIALTEQIEEILARRKSDRRPGCDLIFHHDGAPIVDYRKCWHSACVCLGLRAYYCRKCHDAQGRYTFMLDVDKKCSVCG